MSTKKAASVMIIGFLLALIAGWIDTLGLYFFLDENSSFLTGRIAKLGRVLMEDKADDVKMILVIILFFILGAFLSAQITKKAGLFGGLLFTGALIIISSFSIPYMGAKMAFIILPMSMGSQNTATSLTPIGRTTHLSGPITDIGISIADGNWKRTIFWLLRLVGFFSGTFVAYYLVKIHDMGLSNLPYLLFASGIAMILISFAQKCFLKIPLTKSEQ